MATGVMEPEARPAAGAAPGRLDFADGLAWLVLDEPGKKVNTLSTRLFGWFEEQLAAVERERPDGLVLASGKPGFLAGADIEELVAATDRADVLAIVRRGHELLARLEALPFPTVAAIHGACLGGGLELALGCRFRVATTDPKTRLGVPEVQLGLIPGLGGTQRLPRLVGVAPALDLLLTGRQIDARKARRIGLVDDVCHPADLRRAAARWARGEGQPAARRSLATRGTDLLARVPFADRLVWEKARQGVLAETRGHYPAPLVALGVARDGLSLPLPRALEVEAGAFAELAVAEPAKSLMSIFFKKNEVEARAARLVAGSREVASAGVLGAGFMGAGIAGVLAEKGLRIELKDRDLAAAGKGLAACRVRFEDLRRRKRLTEPGFKAALARLHATDSYAGMARVDLVIEAVFEDLEVKRRVLREVEAAAGDDLIFASNTSAIPIARIAEASRRPENVVGMHFFSPVHRMPLLEVVRHPGTSPEALATAVAVGRTMGKTVVVVNDGPGFFTSRVLGPYLNEAAWLLAEGVPIDRIDAAAVRWGWPVGPFALLDEVGLDVAAHAGGVMREASSERVAPPPVFEKLLAGGRTGRKGGRGFYLYGESTGKDSGKDKGKAKRVDSEVYGLLGWQELGGNPGEEEIAERLWLQMLNETARCMEEGILTEPAGVDVAVIFGFGFPPFRGGILREADRLGVDRVVERLEGYAARHGARFEPAALLTDMARRGASFHG